MVNHIVNSGVLVYIVVLAVQFLYDQYNVFSRKTFKDEIWTGSLYTGWRTMVSTILPASRVMCVIDEGIEPLQTKADEPLEMLFSDYRKWDSHVKSCLLPSRGKQIFTAAILIPRNTRNAFCVFDPYK